MKTLTLLTTLALVVSAFGQATNTNRGTVQVPTRPIRSESTNVAPVPTPDVPLRTPPATAAPVPRVTNLTAAATNLTQAATNLEAAAANIATATNPAAATATGAVTTTTTTTTATNRTTLQPARTNVARPSTIPTPTPPGPRPGTPSATTAAAGAATLPTAPSPTSPITAVSTNAAADDVIIPPGLIKFQEADLAHVLEFYQQLTGRTVLRPQTLPQTKITLITQAPLTRREAVQALDSILSMNQITMVPQGDKFVKAVPAAQSPTEAREFNQLPHMDIPNSGSVVAQIVQLSNAVPRDVAQALQPFAKLPNSILGIDSAGILILRDYAENVKRMMEVLAKIDVVPVQEFEPVVIPIKYALAGDIAEVIGSLTSSGGGATTVGRQQTRAGLSTGGFGGGTGGLGGAGGFGGAQPGQQGYNPQGTTGLGAAGGLGGAAAGRSSFANRLQQIVNRAATSGDIVVLGNTKIIADERTNSLLIFASKTDINTIKDIVEKLDVVLAQVIIEALVLEVGLNDNYQFGISYLQRRKDLGGGSEGAGGIINSPPGIPIGDITQITGSNALQGGFSYFAKWGDFDVAIRAAASDGRISVLSRPRVQTSHAVEANLFVGETRPYPTSSQFGGVYGSYSSIQQLQIGITLSVLPLINPDGLVVMDIRQKIQDIGPSVTIQGVGEVPSTIDREANAKVAVRDGESVVLGGLISSQKTEGHGGVPILKDIPVLGWLFRSSTKDANRRELMVFVRPTVLPTPEAAAITAAAEKEKLPGISRTEYEVNEAERKRLEEYELEKAHHNEEALREVQRQQKKRDAEQLRELERTQREEEKLRREQQEKQRELMKKEGFKQ
jgi:general secretion pathway protein D